MLEHSQHTPGSQEAKTSAECQKVVNKLVKPGFKNGNFFAMCVIGHETGGIQTAIRGGSMITAEEVYEHLQSILDDLKKDLNTQHFTEN